MGMTRLRHVLAILSIPAALCVFGCAMKSSPADAPASPRPEQERLHAGYGDAAPAATASPMPGQYPAAPGGLMWPTFDEAPAADLGGLQSQLDRAEQALGLALGLRVSSGADSAGSPKAPPQPAPTATAAAPATPATQADPCLIACAALASMKRSADHLCGMAGEKDTACGGARERVQRAEQRVTQACTACAPR